MKALVFDGQLSYCDDYPVPTPAPGEVLVRVHRAGICNTDIEITVVGSRCGPFEPALRLLERRLIEVETLLDAEYPIHEGVDAFKRAMTPGTLKVQIVLIASPCETKKDMEAPASTRKILTGTPKGVTHFEI